MLWYMPALLALSWRDTFYIHCPGSAAPAQAALGLLLLCHPAPCAAHANCTTLLCAWGCYVPEGFCLQAAVTGMPAGGEGPLCRLEDARADLTKVLTRSAHGAPKEAELDYLISCQPISSDQLWVAAGSTTGFAACFSVKEPASSGLPCHVSGPLLMAGQHTDIVRSLVWLNTEERRCISGGEDGKIIVWHAGDGEVPVEQALKRQRLH